MGKIRHRSLSVMEAAILSFVLADSIVSVMVGLAAFHHNLSPHASVAAGIAAFMGIALGSYMVAWGMIVAERYAAGYRPPLAEHRTAPVSSIFRRRREVMPHVKLCGECGHRRQSALSPCATLPCGTLSSARAACAGNFWRPIDDIDEKTNPVSALAHANQHPAE